MDYKFEVFNINVKHKIENVDIIQIISEIRENEKQYIFEINDNFVKICSVLFNQFTNYLLIKDMFILFNAYDNTFICNSFKDLCKIKNNIGMFENCILKIKNINLIKFGLWGEDMISRYELTITMIFFLIIVVLMFIRDIAIIVFSHWIELLKKYIFNLQCVKHLKFWGVKIWVFMIKTVII